MVLRDINLAIMTLKRIHVALTKAWLLRNRFAKCYILMRCIQSYSVYFKSQIH